MEKKLKCTLLSPVNQEDCVVEVESGDRLVAVVYPGNEDEIVEIIFDEKRGVSLKISKTELIQAVSKACEMLRIE